MKRFSDIKVLLSLACAASLMAGLTGCSGGGGGTTPVSVSISPATARGLAQGAVQSFSAFVSGMKDTGVTWSIQEGVAGGSIDSSGRYTAPNTAGSFHVIATSQADGTKSATALVTVLPVAVSLSPTAMSMAVGESMGFVANVTGTVNNAVTWSVQEGATGGQVTTKGVYSAPGGTGTFHVIATSQADNTKSGIATVTVSHVSVNVQPASDVLGPQGVRQFIASVTAIQQAVNWSLLEGSSGGTIAANGLYTAPGTTGNFHAIATSILDPSKSGTSTVSIVASGFSPTGSMSNSRSAPSATVLPNGKVLVAGGEDLSEYYYYYYSSAISLKSTEIYDPGVSTFSQAPNMVSTRVFHTATLLPNGKVLLAGGPGASAELYDPVTGVFTATGSMSTGRSGHTATLLQNGKILIAGGDSLTGALASAELYDAASGTFTSTGSLANARTSHTATLLGNGKVLISGGSDGKVALATAELYDPASGTFSPAPSLSVARFNHSATLLTNGNVLIAGGEKDSSPLNTAELYDSTNGTFSMIGNMLQPRSEHVAVRLSNGTVLLAGGTTGGYTAELYDPTTATFTQTGSMSVERQLAAAVLLMDGRVLIVGGSTYSAEIYK